MFRFLRGTRRKELSVARGRNTRMPRSSILRDSRRRTGQGSRLRNKKRRVKAIRVTKHGGPEVLHVADVPAPTVGQGQVLIRVAAAGVNPVDAYIRAGAYSMSNLPYTPGFDAAGTVEKIGPDVDGVKAGDRVYSSAT